MHIDDGVHAQFLSTAVEKRKQAAGVVSMPMRDHNAFNGAKRRSEAGQIAGEGFGVGTGVEEGESGRVRRLACLLGWIYISRV